MSILLAVSVGIGEIIYSDHYVSDDLTRKLPFVGVPEYAGNPTPIVLGYHFLLKHHAENDWDARMLRFPKNK